MTLAILGGKPHFETQQHVGGPIVEPEVRARFHELSDQAFDRNYLTNSGPLAEELELEIARIHGVKEAVLIANGFLAQYVLMLCLDLGPGEAIVASNTFVASPHACEVLGLKVKFCDLDPETLNLDPDLLEKLITPETKAVVPTHIFGVISDMPRLAEICRKHGVRLVADAAHAFDCDRGGVRPGNFGAPEFLSFHATKYFSTIEGGAILTDDPDLAAAARNARNFGFRGPGDAELLGINAKMSEISAAFGLASLPALPARRGLLRDIREVYKERLGAVPGLRIHPVDGAGRNNYRYFAFFVGDEFPLSRDELDLVLRAENILPRSYFFPGCHRMGYYKERAHLALPNTEKALGGILCLPTSFVDAESISAAHAVADIIESAFADASAIRKAIAGKCC